MPNSTMQAIRVKSTSLAAVPDERARRLWAAAGARAIGRGGITRVAEATGLPRVTIRAGLGGLDLPQAPAGGREGGERLRRPGGGRKPPVDHDPGPPRDLETLVDPVTRGDPMSPLRWTCKSAAKLADGLRSLGHAVSAGGQPPAPRHGLRPPGQPQGRRGRDAQFEHINRGARAFQKRGQPAVSVDAKKKELVGRGRNGGREWQPGGEPEEVKVHDFIDKDLGKAIPHGVYDLAADAGWVSVGAGHDTAESAAESLRRWWRNMGGRACPQAKRPLITADGGGSNGGRCRLWRVELQGLADETGLSISACHSPPGTSKWNKIEHRMSCHITESWRGRPPASREVVVNLIGHTTTRAGLAIRSELDEGSYPTGREVADEQLGGLSIRRERFHGEGNYTILPRR